MTKPNTIIGQFKIALMVMMVTSIFISCTSSRTMTKSSSSSALSSYVDTSQVLNSYFFGIQLYDLEENRVLYEHNADHYFTPASNTKLLTLYTATKYLEDSLVWMERYRVNGVDVYQPMGDPSFLYPDLMDMQKREKYFAGLEADTIRFSLFHFKDKRFGSGWAWDDYDESYQTEKSAFPIHSNLVRFGGQGVDTFIHPSFVPTGVSYRDNAPQNREWNTNHFFLSMEEEKWIPFHVDSTLLVDYFRSQGKAYKEFSVDLSQTRPLERLMSMPSDSVYKVYMQRSDNHIAEQLLLQASQLRLGYMQTDSIIAVAQEEVFGFVQDSLLWADGSGLSRYNMFTPRSLVSIVNKLVEEKGIPWLKTILAAGGQSGTIASYYSYDPPRVFAKTGTLRNNHCLTGIVHTRSGKWLSFSMMHNHYPKGSSITKKEMENLLALIVERW